jgi:hypothetical protein
VSYYLRSNFPLTEIFFLTLITISQIFGILGKFTLLNYTKLVQNLFYICCFFLHLFFSLSYFQQIKVRCKQLQFHYNTLASPKHKENVLHDRMCRRRYMFTYTRLEHVTMHPASINNHDRYGFLDIFNQNSFPCRKFLRTISARILMTRVLSSSGGVP